MEHHRESRDRDGARGDTLLLAVNAVYTAWAAAIGLQHGRASEALWIGLGLLAASAAIWALARGSLTGRLGMAAMAIALVSLQIHVGQGQNLYHFGVFVTLAILLVYRDWRVPVFGAALVAVQHASFNVLQQAGWGTICFTEPGWDQVIAHAAYVVVQTGMEVHIALRLAYEARRDQEIQRLLLDADGNVNLDLRNVSATTDLGAQVLGTLRLMQDAVTQVKATALRIEEASSRTARDTAEIAERATDQSQQLVQTAGAVQQLAATVAQNSESAHHARTLAESTEAIAGRGGEAVQQVASTMQDIAESSARISDIIGLIDGIAFQTNILALNAAVEAARAGEQGRGFAVVASEVRGLAQRSAEAARETKALILQSRSKVEGGARLVDDAGRTMEEMLQAVKTMARLVSDIAVASGEQARGIADVSRSVRGAEEATRENRALVQDCAGAAQEMAERAVALAQAISRFNLGGSGAVPAKQEGPRLRMSYGRPVLEPAS